MQIVPRQLGSLGASWDNPLRPEELPAGILFIYPRYVLKVLDDLLSGDISLQQCEEWARNPPDWVKAKANKLGQDSYRLACFIRHRLNHRIPKNWFDSQIDSDAALVIEGRWKYNDLSIQTLSEWSVAPPNWKPWNRNKDVTAVVMPAILWARKVASARAGVDIPFFVDSTVEEIADTIITSDKTTKMLLGVLETACNAIATAGTAEIVKEGVKAGTKEAVKEGAKKTLTEQAITYGTEKAKAEARKQAGKLVSSISKEQSSRKGQEAALALGTGAIAGGVAFLTATPPVGWIAIGVIAFTPILCWGAKEAALKLVMSNLRDWFPDFVPTFIGSVYEQRFGVVPGPDVIASLDARYSGLISANSIAKAVASSENDPAVIAAIVKRQNEIQATIRDSLKTFGCPNPNPDRVASFAGRAFDNFWPPTEINRRAYNEKAWLCAPPGVRELRTLLMRPSISKAASDIARQAAKIRGVLPPIPPAVPSKPPAAPPDAPPPKPPITPPTGPAPAKGGIGAALVLAAGGALVGGPPGAGVGFVIGLIASGKKKP